MKKYLSIVLFLLTMGTTSFGQTYATDFTATDCNSVSHSLFSELNNGKIIVLVWIMPCGSCISDAIAAYDAVQSFAVSHPGKVKMYLIDDFGNASCATLGAWATTNGVTPDAIFDNVGVLINENDYGGGGMPHVVVVGGVDHKIFFNVKDGSNNQIPITNAINEAINPTGIGEANQIIENLQLFPSPANEKLTLNYNMNTSGEVKVSITNIQGAVIKGISLPKQNAGSHTMNIDLSSIGNGVYFLELNAAEKKQVSKFTIAH